MCNRVKLVCDPVAMDICGKCFCTVYSSAGNLQVYNIKKTYSTIYFL